MEKLIRLVLCIAFMVSCNVVQMIKQDDGKVPDEFFVDDILPFNLNPFTATYNNTRDVLKRLESLTPNSGFVGQEAKFMSPVHEAWSTDWSSSTPFYSNYVESSVSTSTWIQHQTQIIEIDKGGGDKYESFTWSMLNSLNTICAVGIYIGNELGLDEFSYPPNGTYEVMIDAKAAYSFERYCDMTDQQDLIGMGFQVVISDVTGGIYDKRIEMMGETHYLRHNSNTTNYNTVSFYGGNNYWSKIVIADDRTSNGYRLEFIDGSNNGDANDNDEQWAGRIWYDSTSVGATLGPMHFIFIMDYDSDGAGDSRTVTSIAGNTNTSASDRVSVKMTSNYLSSWGANTDVARGCVNRSNWSMHTDNAECNSGNEVPGVNTDSTEASAFYTFANNYNGAYTTMQAHNENTITGFTVPGDIGTGIIPGSSN